MRPSSAVPPSDNSETTPHFVIWGTDVSVQVCKKKFRQFLTTFVDPEEDLAMDDVNAGQPMYLQKLEEVRIRVQ